MALKTPADMPAAKAGWMKTGEASASAAAAEQAAFEKRKSEQGKAWRYYMEDGEEARITFVDGNLSDKGYLLPPRYFEHNIMLNGKFGNTYVCPQQTNPDANDKCPLCESGDSPSLVSLFTVIDHRVFQSKKTPGKTYTNTPKLYAAKSITFEQLNKLAQKIGGLAGSTWDVSRSGAMSANVGNGFFPVGKEPDIQKLKQQYIVEVVDPKTNAKTTKTVFVPLDYEHEIVYRTGDELRKMGFGKPAVQVPSGFQQGPGEAGMDYGKHL